MVVGIVASIPLMMGQSCGPVLSPTTQPSPGGDDTPATTCGESGSHCLPAAGPVAVVVADLNHDFAVDIAVASSNDDSVSIWLNVAHGDFVTGGKFAIGDNPTGMVAADFNGDGNIDLAVSSVAGTLGPAAVVLLGKGDGTFFTAVAYPVSGAGASITAGDITGDGRPDLMVPVPQLGTVSILVNDGTGQFFAPVDLPAGTRPVAVAVADLDHDGDVDLAVADSSGGAVVLRSNPVGGNFFPAITFGAGVRPSWIAAADVDGDGDPDLVVTSAGATTDAAADTVSVLPNNGNGTFTTARTFAAGVNPSFVSIADLNGDGLPDLAIADFGSAQGTASAQGAGAAVLLNSGGGTFAALVLYPAGVAPQALAIGDLNRDTRPDIVVANFGSNDLTLLPNYGAGVFSPPQPAP